MREASGRGIRPVTRHRRHGNTLDPDRRELERAGWRTTLDYHENHVRGRDGSLEHLERVWRAEAERIDVDGTSHVVSASASSTSKVWSRLRTEADLALVRTRRRRLQRL